MVILAVTLLLLDELGSFQEVVLNPVLCAVEDERIDHHHEEELQVCVALENTQYIHRERDKNFSIFKKEPEDEQLGNRENHQPDQQLYEVYFVVDVSVQLLVAIPVDVLGIVEVEVDTTLQNDNIIFRCEQCY